ncbi:SET domain-containing protein [Obba rivulosa]|uniref:SET domain-containing protein n=1 Tax=Obba rivulosa TaxID=1052685 RepID=A0A8E2B534_9APHY|nr:SET domain-containing protein [Obba rivulosa]
MPLKTPSPLRYRILQPADGRYIGLGMFATADFDVGDLILQERALLITTQFIPPGPNGYSAADAALHMAVYEQMLPACRTAYLSLSNSFPSEQQEITGILNTNALYIGALPGYDGACGGVFNDISRINHSCCPNAVFRWDLASFSGQVHALAPVRCGEQIYLSYVDMCNPRKVRQQLLLDKYKFHCTCASCMLRGAGSQYSDLRRAFIAAQAAEDISERKTDDDVLAWTSNPALPERMLVDAAEIWLAWMLEERVMEERLCRVVLSRLCKAYAALEDEEGVKRCARHAAALEKAWIGHDGGWLAVAANPRNTLWWGLRTMPRF